MICKITIFYQQIAFSVIVLVIIIIDFCYAIESERPKNKVNEQANA